jgi:DAK2 domain fusion protein YloV
MTSVCKAISHGSLMGARGNSGVILSQILRGLASAFDGGAGDGDCVATALADAAVAAYAAVMRPVEGTILTVAKAAGDGASTGGSTLVGVLEAAKSAAAEALARTPELLPVLKQAGVVDAGGAGYVLLLDVLLAVVDGREVPAPPVPTGAAPEIRPEVDEVHAEGGDVSDLRYEVMYFLEAPDVTIPSFKEVWASIGDSIVVVGGDGIWNCHIHTDDIGAAIEAALDCGRPKRIRVTDLLEQVEEERWVRDASSAAADDDGSDDEQRTPVPCAVVAVATGEGIRRIFRSLGVQQIVAGGQSMNPSTAQILEAVEHAPGDQVVILPNNKNIIPVAEQVAALTDKPVQVIRTTGIAEGFGALLEYDPQATAEENLELMTRAASRVVSGEVTRAVRDSTTDAGPVKEGEYLGLRSSKIVVVAPTLADAATELLAAIVGDDAEIVTLIEGDGASPATTRHLTEWLAEHRPEAAAEVHHGGQPLYPYLFSVE